MGSHLERLKEQIEADLSRIRESINRLTGEEDAFEACLDRVKDLIEEAKEGEPEAIPLVE